MTTPNPPSDGLEPTNWILPADAINALQQASIARMVERAHGAHIIDIVVRKDAVETRYEADWVKHLVVEITPTAPAKHDEGLSGDDENAIRRAFKWMKIYEEENHTFGDDVVGKAELALTSIIAKHAALEAKYKILVEFYDRHNGTPCEQIRHKQELEAQEALIKELCKTLERLKFFINSRGIIGHRITDYTKEIETALAKADVK